MRRLTLILIALMVTCLMLSVSVILAGVTNMQQTRRITDLHERVRLLEQK